MSLPNGASECFLRMLPRIFTRYDRPHTPHTPSPSSLFPNQSPSASFLQHCSSSFLLRERI